MTAISPELRAFLADWLAWVERGAPDGELYSRDYGLCDNASYCNEAKPAAIRLSLVDAFAADGLDDLYPFGGYEFAQAEDTYTMHEDKNRLAWVRAKLAEPVA